MGEQGDPWRAGATKRPCYVEKSPIPSCLDESCCSRGRVTGLGFERQTCRILTHMERVCGAGRRRGHLNKSAQASAAACTLATKPKQWPTGFQSSSTASLSWRRTRHRKMGRSTRCSDTSCEFGQGADRETELRIAVTEDGGRKGTAKTPRDIVCSHGRTQPLSS